MTFLGYAMECVGMCGVRVSQRDISFLGMGLYPTLPKLVFDNLLSQIIHQGLQITKLIWETLTMIILGGYMQN